MFITPSFAENLFRKEVTGQLNKVLRGFVTSPNVWKLFYLSPHKLSASGE
jgi:hypothetical protein